MPPFQPRSVFQRLVVLPGLAQGARGADHLEGRIWAGPWDVCRPLPLSASRAANPVLPAARPRAGSAACLLHHPGCLGDELQGRAPRFGAGWDQVEQMSSWTTLLLFAGWTLVTSPRDWPRSGSSWIHHGQRASWSISYRPGAQADPGSNPSLGPSFPVTLGSWLPSLILPPLPVGMTLPALSPSGG